MKYISYSEIELQEILDNTRSVSSDPYKLFIAYVVDAIEEYLCQDDEEDDNPIWGQSMPTEDINNIIKSCVDDFVNAANSGLRIDIGDCSYTIRGKNKISQEKLLNVFGFSDNNGTTIVTKDRIFDISQSILSTKSIANNQTFALKVWYYVKTKRDGWDKLTDMEAALYCWMLYAKKKNAKFSPADFISWYDKYSDNIDIPFMDILGCLEGGRKFPVSPFSFSAKKIIEYNELHNQKSIIDTVDANLAYIYWYEN